MPQVTEVLSDSHSLRLPPAQAMPEPPLVELQANVDAPSHVRWGQQVGNTKQEK